MNSIPSFSLDSYNPYYSSEMGDSACLSFEFKWSIESRKKGPINKIKSAYSFDVKMLNFAHVSKNLPQLRNLRFCLLKIPVKRSFFSKVFGDPKDRDYQFIALKVKDFIWTLGIYTTALVNEWDSWTEDNYFENMGAFVQSTLEKFLFAERCSKITSWLIQTKNPAGIIPYFMKCYEKLASYKLELSFLEAFIEEFKAEVERKSLALEDLPKYFDDCLKYLAVEKGDVNKPNFEYLGELGFLIDKLIEFAYEKKCNSQLSNYHKELICEFVASLVEAGGILFLHLKGDAETPSLQLLKLLFIGAPEELVETFVTASGHLIDGFEDGTRPLFYAFYGKNIANIKLVLNARANPLLRANKGESILTAFAELKEGAVSELFPIFEEYSFLQSDREKAIEMAIQARNLRVVKWLCSLSAFKPVKLHELKDRCDNAIVEKNAFKLDQVRKEFEQTNTQHEKLQIHNRVLEKYKNGLSFPCFPGNGEYIEVISERIEQNNIIINVIKALKDAFKNNRHLTKIVAIEPSASDPITKEELINPYAEAYFQIEENGTKRFFIPWTLNLETWQAYFTYSQNKLFSPSDPKMEVKKIETIEEMCEAGVHYLISSEKLKTQLTG